MDSSWTVQAGRCYVLAVVSSMSVKKRKSGLTVWVISGLKKTIFRTTFSGVSWDVDFEPKPTTLKLLSEVWSKNTEVSVNRDPRISKLFQNTTVTHTTVCLELQLRHALDERAEFIEYPIQLDGEERVGSRHIGWAAQAAAAHPLMTGMRRRITRRDRYTLTRVCASTGNSDTYLCRPLRPIPS
ncbi:hypothetical protein B0H11DRAFT_1153814 [Mycena galericulata]|nr:hypothetical protein B0H11DRAFT_1153814 [Mycena galericulata]